MKLRVKRIIFIIMFCVFGAIALGQSPMRFHTNLVSLLNMENVDGWPVQDIIGRFSSVINVVVQSEDRFTGDIAARKIYDMINSDEMPEFEVMVDNFSGRNLVSVMGKYHNVMIDSQSRELLRAGRFADITKNAKLKLESSVAPNLLPISQDPFLLFTNYVAALSGLEGAHWMPQNGILWQYRAPYNFYMLPIQVNVSNNDSLVNAVKKLKHEINKMDNVHIYIGGAPVHTAEMYSRSKIELEIISILAVIAVVVLNYMLFRCMKSLLPIMASLLFGYASGTLALFLCFGMPHILTLVFGTSLIGLGIDYAFHFINAGNQKDAKLVQKNIWYSLLTTIICFVPLMFSSISLLRQISVFTIVGLVSIYVFIKLFVSCRIVILNKKFVHPLNKKYRFFVFSGLIVGVVVACAFARFENNMTALYKANPEIMSSERKIAELNQSDKSGVLVVRGRSIQQVLENEEAIRDSGVGFMGVSSFVPSLLRQMENQELVKQLYASQSKIIRKELGLKNVPHFIDNGYVNIEQDDVLAHRVKNFLFEKDDWFYSVSSVSADTVVAHENARVIVPTQQIQAQMIKYSQEVYRLLGICGIFLIVVLLVLYRWGAFRYLVPPLMGVGAAIGILTIFGMPVTFFHLLGLFIVIGLGLDYAIFHINSGSGGEMWPVFYSFLTSFIGFGLLAFTGFSIISALGITLALGIAVSYVVSLYLFRN